jgi:predicted nucleic acid-binding protein
MGRIFVDTSAIYALLDRDDRHHVSIRKRFEQLKQSRTEPILSNFVVAESHALLLSRLGPAIARRWLVNNIWTVERISEEDEVNARAIIDAYSDKGFSYTDATSFALMERLHLRRALALDKHFRQYGFQTE